MNEVYDLFVNDWTEKEEYSIDIASGDYKCDGSGYCY